MKWLIDGPLAAFDLETTGISVEQDRIVTACVALIGGAPAWKQDIHECRRHDLPTVDERLGRPIAPVVDVYVLDKHIDPYRKGSRTLDALWQHYEVRHDGLHDAITDALAAARVAYRIALLTQDFGVREHFDLDVAAKLAGLANVSAAQLHRFQIGWWAGQCDSLRAYFDHKGIEHDGVPGDWPMIRHVAQEAMPV